MNDHLIGETVGYIRDGRAIAGIVAEVAVCPLTGQPKARVCDLHTECKDPDAGRWVRVSDLRPCC